MAAWLVERGHDVRVITAPPYYPEWKIGKGYTAYRWMRECWRGADVWRCPVWVPSRPGGGKRLLHLASFALSSFPIMLKQLLWRPDMVFVVEPPLFGAPIAWLVSRLGGAVAWLHIQDYEVDAAFELGILRGNWIKRVVLAGEHWLMRRFDVISTISQRMQARARAKGVSDTRLVKFPNWVDLETFSGIIVSQSLKYRTELGIPSRAVVALYSGNMGAKQGLELLGDVARLCASNDSAHLPIYFVFCGNGIARASLVAQCEGLEFVRFLDLQPSERLPELLAMADIHLLPQRAEAADLVMPSKLTGMLASSRPVVAAANSGTELAEVVEGCGLVVPPEDPQAMASAVRTLAADSALRRQLGAAGLDHAVRYMDREAVLKDFEAIAADFIARSSR